MQILAHSVVPPNPVPYLHLGYISAGANARTTQAPGYLFIASGIVLSALLGVILIRKGISPATRRVGLALLLVSILVFTLSQIPWPSRYAHPEEASQDHAWKVYKRIAVTRKPGDPIPSDLQALSKIFPYTKDGWNREMHIATYQAKGKEAYAIISAGQDGQFGTGDDIAVIEGSLSHYPGKRRANLVLQELTDSIEKEK